MPHLNVLCRDGMHCPTCRAEGAAADAWREGIAKHYSGVPEDWPACPRGLPMGWVSGIKCSRCNATWHEVERCPIDPNYVASPEAAREGGCGCSGDQQKDGPTVIVE